MLIVLLLELLSGSTLSVPLSPPSCVVPATVWCCLQKESMQHRCRCREAENLLSKGAKTALETRLSKTPPTDSLVFRTSDSSPLIGKNIACRWQGLLTWCVGAVACPAQQQQVPRNLAFDVPVNTNFFLCGMILGSLGEYLNQPTGASPRGFCPNHKMDLTRM